MKSSTVQRHTLTVRVCHWAIALSGLLLVFSGIGFMPLYGRFYLNALPGLGWVSDFQTQLDLHYASAAVFLAAGCFHLVYHLRRGETALVPRGGDLGESLTIVKAMFTGKEEPPHDKFLAEQRLTYGVVMLISAILVLTGLFLSFKNLSFLVLHPGLLQATTLVHLAATFLFFPLVAAHLAAFLVKPNRPLLGSIITGRVDRAYAARRHRKWQI